MKKKILIITCTMLLTLACVPAYADVGMTREPIYTATINIYGTKCYDTYEDYQNGISSGSLAGGMPFIVWNEYYEWNMLWGSTDQNATPGDNSFVLISKDDVVSDTDTISPDVGQKEPAPVEVITLDELNIRCGPGTGFKVITTLDKDAEITYDYTFNTDTTWLYVQAGDTRGWVNGDYVRAIEKPAVVTENKTTTNNNDKDNDSDNTAVAPNGQDTVKDKKTAVAGIILICIGVAILIAAFVLYYLRQNKRKVESLKVKE